MSPAAQCLGRFEEAAAVLDELLARDPNHHAWCDMCIHTLTP